MANGQDDWHEKNKVCLRSIGVCTMVSKSRKCKGYNDIFERLNELKLKMQSGKIRNVNLIEFKCRMIGDKRKVRVEKVDAIIHVAAIQRTRIKQSVVN